MLPRKIKAIRSLDIIRKLDLPDIDKNEFATLMNGYFLSVYDVMRASLSNIKLGGNMWLINPVIKKKSNKS